MRQLKFKKVLITGIREFESEEQRKLPDGKVEVVKVKHSIPNIVGYKFVDVATGKEVILTKDELGVELVNGTQFIDCEVGIRNANPIKEIRSAKDAKKAEKRGVGNFSYYLKSVQGGPKINSKENIEFIIDPVSGKFTSPEYEAKFKTIVEEEKKEQTKELKEIAQEIVATNPNKAVSLLFPAGVQGKQRYEIVRTYIKGNPIVKTQVGQDGKEKVSKTVNIVGYRVRNLVTKDEKDFTKDDVVLFAAEALLKGHELVNFEIGKRTVVKDGKAQYAYYVSSSIPGKSLKDDKLLFKVTDDKGRVLPEFQSLFGTGRGERATSGAEKAQKKGIDLQAIIEDLKKKGLKVPQGK